VNNTGTKKGIIMK